MQIKWTDKAEESFAAIIDYLSENWSQKEVNDFIEKTDKVIDNISQNPSMYAVSIKRKNVRRALIGKLTSLLYTVKHKTIIELLLFWDNRRNPKKLKV